MKYFRFLALLVLVGAVVSGLPSVAEGSHFRYGTLSWVPTGNPGEVEFRLTAAFRRGYSGSGPDSRAVTGDIITETIGGTSLLFGDATSTSTLRFRVTAYSVTEDWVIGEALHPSTTTVGVRHTYAGAGPYTAAVSSCCRIFPMNNRSSGSYRLETIVLPKSGNRSPVSTLVPIVTVSESSASTFFIPAVDADGDLLRWRDATSAEAGGGSNPSGMSINSSTGLVTWNNVGFNQTNFWTAQFVIEDLDTNGNIKSKTPVDFLLKIVQVVGVPPSCTINPPGPLTVSAGSLVSFTVTGTDPDAGATVTINTGGLPAGATMTPGLPITGPSGVNSAFNWTPTAAQAGIHVVLFSVTDNTGQQSLCSITINVIANLPPDCSGAYPSIAEIWPPNHKMVNISILGVTDPDGDPVTITITKITQDEPLNGLGDGDTAPDGAGIGTSTAQVRAERAGTPKVPGNGRVYMISFVASDGKGGTCNGSVAVCVPHDQRPGHVCIDDGQNYNSTAASKPVALEFAPEADLTFGMENYPNPFNPSTTIRYTLPEASNVRLTIYNVLGQEVRTLVNAAQSRGVHSVQWDGRDASGRQAATGIYIYRLEAGQFVATRNMVFTK